MATNRKYNFRGECPALTRENGENRCSLTSSECRVYSEQQKRNCGTYTGWILPSLVQKQRQEDEKHNLEIELKNRKIWGFYHTLNLDQPQEKLHD